jgi:hypothetical protein
MPGFLLTMSCVVTCAHGGQAKPTAPNPRVRIMGTPVPMSAAPFVVAGCSMAIPPPAGPGPTPCLTAMFLPPTVTIRVKSMGQGLLCQTSMTGPAVTTPPSPPAPLLPVSFAGQTRVRGM